MSAGVRKYPDDARPTSVIGIVRDIAPAELTADMVARIAESLVRSHRITEVVAAEVKHRLAAGDAPAEVLQYLARRIRP